MSHFKEREDKNCLNCGTGLNGRFCHKCGQENIEPKESIFHLIGHLISHEFHFDSKFISTARHLLLTPGLLTKEYMEGRRASYLDPIRMYIFLSALFFLVAFSFSSGGDNIAKVEINNTDVKKAAIATIKELQDEIKDSLKEAKDDELSVVQIQKLKERDAQLAKYQEILSNKNIKADSIANMFVKHSHVKISFWGAEKYNSLEEYDSVQKSLPNDKKDNFIQRSFTRKGLLQKAKAEDNLKEFLEHIKEEMIHSFSEIFFLSLPFFALILQLLYLRNKQNFFYVNHFVYTLHLYSGGFFIFIVGLLVDKIKEGLGWHWLNYIIGALAVYGIYFSYKSMRTFYGQSRRKTIAKYILLSLCSMILFAFLLGVFLAISALKA